MWSVSVTLKITYCTLRLVWYEMRKCVTDEMR